MASYRGHISGGVVAYGMGIVLLQKTYPSLRISYSTLLLWFIATMMGSLLPDCDISSKGQKLFYGSCLVIVGILLAARQHGVAAYGLSIACIPLLVGHRKIVHTLTFWIISMAALAYGVCYLLGSAIIPELVPPLFFVLIGVSSHLFLDGYGLRRAQRLLYIISKFK